ncbi:MAG: hypothetical protein ACRD0B_01975 [Acidimicrobiales bacterium]
MTSSAADPDTSGAATRCYPGKAPSVDVRVDFDVEVPMRDGVRLRANVFRPPAGRWPGLLTRLPYSERCGSTSPVVRHDLPASSHDIILGAQPTVFRAR